MQRNLVSTTITMPAQINVFERKKEKKRLDMLLLFFVPRMRIVCASRKWFVLVAIKDGPNPTGMSITDRYDLEIAGEKQGMRSKTENKMNHARDRNRKPTATSPASVCRYQFGCLGETKNKRQKRLTIRSSFFESFFWLCFFGYYYYYYPGEGMRMRMRNDLLTASG